MAQTSFLTRVRRSLIELLRTDDSSDTKPSPTGFQVAPVPPPATTGDFGSRLGEILGEAGTSVHAGKVNLIGLERIKQRFGPEWERIADRAARIARNAIERHLAPGDIFTDVRGMTFVIVFATLDLDRAQLKCRLIAHEIAKALLGEDGAADLDVKTAVARVDGSIGFSSVPSLEDLLALPAFAAAEHAAEDGPKIDCDELIMVPVTPPAAELPKAAVRSSDPLAGLQFAWRPSWWTAQNVISAYRCVGLLPTSDIGEVYGEADLAVEGDINARAKLDFAALAHVLAEIERISTEKFKVLVGVNVDFETLAPTVRRRQFTKEIIDHLNPESKGLFVINLVGIPRGAPASRLVEMIGPLRQHCRAITARLDIDVTDFSAFKGIGVASVGCDIANSAGTELQIMQRMSRFARAADKIGVAAHIDGVRTLSLLAAAVGAGFRYIDGDVVAKLVSRPRRVLNFHLVDAYRSLARD